MYFTNSKARLKGEWFATLHVFPLQVIWLWDSSKMVSVVTKHRRKRYQRAQAHVHAKSHNKRSTEDDSVEEEKKDK